MRMACGGDRHLYDIHKPSIRMVPLACQLLFRKRIEGGLNKVLQVVLLLKDSHLQITQDPSCRSVKKPATSRT